MIQSFAELFSFADMQAIRVASKARRDIKEDGPEKTAAIHHYFDVCKDKMGSPLGTYLKEKHQLGLMLPLSNSSGYDSRFAKTWNEIAGNTEKYQENPDTYWDSLLNYYMRRTVHSLAGDVCPFTETPEWPEERLYREVVATVDSGNLEWFMVDISEQCGRTGLILSHQFNNWVPEVWYFDQALNKHLKAESREAGNNILHTSVTFPSGHLLVADWFRIDAFNALVKKNDLPTLNSQAGIEAQVRHYAENFDFISVFVGNTCPTVFTSATQLVVGHEFENVDSRQYAPRFKVCTDLWWTTVIDKKTLISHLTKATGTDATSMVEAYLEDNDVAEVHVPPGTYHLYFDNDDATFREKFAASGIDLTGIDEPYCIISRNELELIEKFTTEHTLAHS